MSGSTLRGLVTPAVLLCLLPRASALDVTYTKTTAVSGSAIGGAPATFTDLLTYLRPAVADGNLAAVIIDYTFTGTLTSFEVNGYGVPFNLLPFAELSVSVSPSMPYFPTGGSDSIQAPPVLLPLLASNSITGPVALHIAQQSVAPSLLNHFYGAGVSELAATHTAFGNNYWGSVSMNGTATSSIQFVFTAPDTGASWMMLAATVGLVGIVHRRRNRRLPTS
jgi:hypothetical protein